jgi:hypothetical protein
VELQEACQWGLLGALLSEGWLMLSAIDSTGHFPWNRQRDNRIPLGPYVTAVFIRVALGIGAAAAIGSSGQICGPMGAVAVGVAAPKIVQELSIMGLSHPAVEAPPATRMMPRPEEGRVDAR